jgi:hypothetical protein
MIFLLPAYLFDYKGWYSFFQLTFMTTRNDIPSSSLPWRNIIPCSKKSQLEEGISSLVAKKVSWKKEYHPLKSKSQTEWRNITPCSQKGKLKEGISSLFCFQLTFLTTRDDIPSFSLPVWLQWMISLLSAYLFDYKGWYSFFQLEYTYKLWSPLSAIDKRIF